jgi:hypothetical protein
MASSSLHLTNSSNRHGGTIDSRKMINMSLVHDTKCGKLQCADSLPQTAQRFHGNLAGIIRRTSPIKITKVDVITHAHKMWLISASPSRHQLAHPPIGINILGNREVLFCISLKYCIIHNRFNEIFEIMIAYRRISQVKRCGRVTSDLVRLC